MFKLKKTFFIIVGSERTMHSTNDVKITEKLTENAINLDEITVDRKHARLM